MSKRKSAEKKEDKISVLGFYKIMLGYQKRYPLLIMLLGICIVLRITYELVFPLISEWLFNSVLYSNDYRLFIYAMGILGVAFVFSMVGSFLQAILTPKITYKVITLLRLKLFGKVQAIQQHREDDDTNFSMYFVSDLNNITNASQYYMWAGITNLSMAIIGTLVLAYFDWKMTLMVAIVFPLSMLLPRFFSKKNREQFSAKYNIEGKLVDKVHESIIMQDVLRLFLLKVFKRKQFRNDLIEAAKAGEAYGTSVEITYRSAGLGILFVQFMVILLGGYFVLHGQITPGRLVGFYFLLTNVAGSINTLMALYPNFNNSIGSLEKIQEFLNRKTFPTHPPSKDVTVFTDKISFKKIHYTSEKNLILKNINLDLPKGKFIAFVGASGSGKSTLLRMILKEINPTKGTIYFDDVKYPDLYTRSLLSQIGVVMQQPKLFATTIRENIRMGKLTASDDEIMVAAQKAGVHEDIMQLPAQYNSIVGQGSVQLSGGQAQRITIARALLSDPKILCLDEVTSALDPISGAAIEDVLRTMVLDHTIISITHRLSSVVKADLIVVLDKGSIVETGTHEDLLKLKGRYSQLWEKQQGFIYNVATRETIVIPEWLTQVPLFATLERDKLAELAHEFVMERESTDKIVFRQNDHGEKFYILVAGIVEIFTTNNKVESVVAKLTDGDFFGEVALLFDTPRNASVRTKGVCIFLTLHYHKFQKVFQQLPKAQQEAIIQIAKQRLSKQQRKTLQL
jgi:ATP-binding cassette subfamily B protein